MKQVRIRAAERRDFEAILAITEEGRPGVSALTQAELDAMLAMPSSLLVAEAGGEIAGYLITYPVGAAYDGEEFVWFSDHYRDYLYIDQVAVGAGWRRAHVGTRLYQTAEEMAATQGLTSITCEVNLEPPNPVSVAFHTRVGFREVGTLETRDGRRVSLLRKEIGR
jgi:predicted GNAT superfamily acetyltransferase